MKQKKAGMSVFSKLIGLFSALMMVSAIVLPVMADEETMPDYHEISLPMTNGARFNATGDYYFKLGGGGLNALHITDSIYSPYGQVTHATGNSGTLYISDTGGRGYDDDIILMLAVNGTIPEDFNLHIESDGYQWTPTDGTVPDEEVVRDNHELNVVDADFGPENFTDYYQIWKPSTSSNYRIYNTQNMSDPSKKFSLMFIDLKVGALGLNSTAGYNDPLIDNGMVRVDYNFTALGSLPAAFNAYSWVHKSNQGDDTVSWTNKLDGTSLGTSGWDFNNGYTLNISPPVANFISNITTGIAPITVQFTDTSSNSPSSWEWSFGDGSSHSYEENPSHTFSTPGIYNISLIAGNSGGNDEILRSGFFNATNVNETPIILRIDNGTVGAIGTTRDLHLVLNKAPAGVTGYRINVSIQNPSIASITGFTFPSWAGLNDNSSFPSQSCTVEAVDINGLLSDGSLNIPLGILTVTGDQLGSTEINATIEALEDNDEAAIEPIVLPGEFGVGFS